MPIEVMGGSILHALCWYNGLWKAIITSVILTVFMHALCWHEIAHNDCGGVDGLVGSVDCTVRLAMRA